jgi:hypothetical protein
VSKVLPAVVAKMPVTSGTNLYQTVLPIAPQTVGTGSPASVVARKVLPLSEAGRDNGLAAAKLSLTGGWGGIAGRCTARL